MLQVERIEPERSDSPPDSSNTAQGGDHGDAATERLRTIHSAATSDGYSPVAFDGGRADGFTLEMAPVAPAPPLTVQRSPKSRQEPARCDVHIQLAREPESRDTIATRVKFAFESKARSTEKDACGESGDGEANCALLGYVNRKSVTLLRNSGSFEPDFQTRMLRFQQKSRQKKEELRQRTDIAGQTGVHMPEINKRSKCLRRRLSHLLAWHSEKENKLTRLRAAETTKELEPCEAKSVVSSRSHHLLGNRCDDLARCKVEDRLQLLGLIYQYEKEERMLQQQRQVTGPRLAPHSLNLMRVREPPVFERLYEQAQQRHQQTADDIHGQRDADVIGGLTDSRSGSSTGRKADVIKRLYMMGDRYKQRRIARSERQAMDVAAMLTIPKLSARSRQLATKRQQSGRSRAATGCTHRRHQQQQRQQQEQQEQSRRRVDAKAADAIYQKHVRWQQQREARRMIERRRCEEAELQECTFRNPWHRTAWSSLEGEPQRLGNEAFYRRSMAWAEQREQALDAEKKIWRELEMMECTFKPRVSRRVEASEPVRVGASAELQPARAAQHGILCDAREAAHLACYSATDLEALAITSCSDWCSDYQDESGSQKSETGGSVSLFRRFSGADAREFAGR